MYNLLTDIKTIINKTVINNEHNALFGLIVYLPVNNFSVMSDGSTWVETVLSSG